MAYSFLYIDDFIDERIKGIEKGLNREGFLSVKLRNPVGNWEKEMDLIINERNNDEYQGILIDLRLQDERNAQNLYSKYRGSSIAQELRNIAKEGDLIDCPIVLLSATENMRKSMDQTNKDLFDYSFEKDSLGEEHSTFERAQQILFALANGYQFLIKKEYSIEDILGNQLALLDKRLALDLVTLRKNKPPHILAGFILKQMIERNGPLICENLLAARMGVDKEQSGNNWLMLLKYFEQSVYKGVFSEGWQRWWFFGIERWWFDTFPEKILRLLDASDRVNLLNDKLQLLLVAQKKTFRSSSEKFWVLCKGTLAPIDVTDGFLIAGQDNIYPWQDKEYVSYDEALVRTNIYLWNEIAPIEKSRYAKLVKPA